MIESRVTDVRLGGYASLSKANQRPRASVLNRQENITWMVMAGLLFLGFALLIVRSNHASVQLGYAIMELKQGQTAQLELNRQLNVELDNLSSLDRLQSLAKNQLGLISPTPSQMVVIK